MKQTVSDNDSAHQRGAASLEEARAWLGERRVEDIECMVPDQAGVARGKLMPAEKFIAHRKMNLPESIFYQTISGDYPDPAGLTGIDPADGDIVLEPDFSTLCMVPWESEPTAQIIHDAFRRDGSPVDMAPRQVLRRVLRRYAEKGLKPLVAPELEFYLVKPNTDPDYPLEPPIGRSGRAEIGRQSFSISAVNEFDPLIDDVYDYAEAQGLEIDTLIHEEGAAQLEINLRHGDPLQLADQAFLFKRTIREAAMKHDIYATFMAKPIAEEPGSAMHIHQSVLDAATGRNVFSDADGSPSQAFHHFIAGMQDYLPAVMCIMAPYVNSYRRLARYTAAPINIQWGVDNRTVGIRIPRSDADARRVENRVPSSDANPYLAIAASLACGLLGMEQKLTPSEPISGSARDLPYDLPRGLLEAVSLFSDCAPIREMLGEDFANCYRAIKEDEFETFMRVISSWEREYLLLNV